MRQILSHPDLKSDDPSRRAAALQAALTCLHEHEQRLSDLKATMTAKLTAVEHRIATLRTTVQDTNTRDDLREALGQLERGPHPMEGTLPEVSPFVGLPGLQKTRAQIARLTEEHTDAVLMRDHSRDRAQYRLRPGFSNRWVNGPNGERRLLPGDIVSMTLAGYRADPDRFEPVEEATPNSDPPERPADIVASQ